MSTTLTGHPGRRLRRRARVGARRRRARHHHPGRGLLRQPHPRERHPHRGRRHGDGLRRRTSRPVVVSRASAFWQLYRATSSTGPRPGLHLLPVLQVGAGPEDRRRRERRLRRLAVPREPRRRRRWAPSDKALAQGDRCSGTTAAPTACASSTWPRPRTAVSKGTASRSGHELPDRTARPQPGRRRSVRYGASAVATADGVGLGHLRRPGARHPGRSAPPGPATSAAPPATSARSPATRRSATCRRPRRPPARPPPTRTRSPPAAASRFPRLGGRYPARGHPRHAGPDRSDVAQRRRGPRAARGHAVPLPHAPGGLSAARLHPRASSCRRRSAGGPTGASASADGAGAGHLARLEPGDRRRRQRRVVGLARVNSGQFRWRPPTAAAMRRAAPARSLAGARPRRRRPPRGRGDGRLRGGRARGRLARAATRPAAPGGQQADAIVALRAAGRSRAALRPRLSALGAGRPGLRRHRRRGRQGRDGGGRRGRRPAAPRRGRLPAAHHHPLRRRALRRDRLRPGPLDARPASPPARAVPAAAVRATLAARARGGWGFTIVAAPAATTRSTPRPR